MNIQEIIKNNPMVDFISKINLSKIIDYIVNNPILTFVSGAIISALISYVFSYIKDRQTSRDNIHLQISNELSKKLYDCSQLACGTHIYHFKTPLNVYKSSVTNARNIEEINRKYNLKGSNSVSSIYEAKTNLSNEKTRLIDGVVALHKSLIEIILYIEANYIILNMFSEHKEEYLELSKRISEVSDELLHLLYFDDFIEWEENLDEELLTSINKKIDKLEKNLSGIDADILGYISDFQVGMQNVFFSKYFRKNFFQRYRVEYRKTLVGKIIKPKKSKTRNLTIYK